MSYVYPIDTMDQLLRLLGQVQDNATQLDASVTS
jgi:hypothetical protein